MIEYLKTIFGLHVGQYTLRLGRQLAGWLEARQAHPTCVKCPVYGTAPHPFADCPYQQQFVTDMDFRSPMARLAQESAAAEYGRLVAFIKALFTMNQLLRYAETHPTCGVPARPADVPTLLATSSVDLDTEFRGRLSYLRSENEVGDESLSPEEVAILDSGLPPFEAFVELVTHVRQKHHQKYLTEMLDKLFQKNGDAGALVQGRSNANPRRWHLGGRLLEVLVQLAVLRWDENEGQKRYYSEPVLFEDFVGWMEARYGFVIAGMGSGPVRQPETLEEHRAYRENVRALKDRLREIGFYDDLSDAYNAQTIRPRYPIDQREAGA
jgi:hypothetical protein